MPLFVAEFQFRYNKCENADIWGKAIKLMTLRPNWIAIASCIYINRPPRCLNLQHLKNPNPQRNLPPGLGGTNHGAS
jgi:hypothetical protein